MLRLSIHSLNSLSELDAVGPIGKFGNEAHQIIADQRKKYSNKESLSQPIHPTVTLRSNFSTAYFTPVSVKITSLHKFYYVKTGEFSTFLN